MCIICKIHSAVEGGNKLKIVAWIATITVALLLMTRPVCFVGEKAYQARTAWGTAFCNPILWALGFDEYLFTPPDEYYDVRWPGTASEHQEPGICLAGMYFLSTISHFVGLILLFALLVKLHQKANKNELHQKANKKTSTHLTSDVNYGDLGR